MIRWEIMEVSIKVIGFKSVAIRHWKPCICKKTFSYLGAQAKGRRIIEAGDAFQIREKTESYNALFGPERCDIALKNGHDWM